MISQQAEQAEAMQVGPVREFNAQRRDVCSKGTVIEYVDKNAFRNPVLLFGKFDQMVKILIENTVQLQAFDCREAHELTYGACICRHGSSLVE